MTTRRRLLASALSAATIPIFAASGRAAGPDHLRLRLDWTPWGNQAAFHLAHHRGWYRRAALEVRIDDGNGSTGTVQIVGTGDQYDAGFAALSSMVIARSKGLPLKAIADYARQSDIGVMVPLSSGITTIAGLRGKRIGYTASSLEAPFVGQFLKAGGLNRSDVELVSLDGAAKLGAYISGKLDAAFSSIPFLIAAVNKARPSRSIGLAAAGLTMPSYGLFARDPVIARKKAPLTRFVTVSDATWAYIAAGHQDEAVDAIRAERPNAKLSAAVMRAQLDSFLTFFPTPASRDDPPGVMALKDWQAAVETMRTAKLVGPGLDASELFTNELFDPAIYKTALKQMLAS